MAHNITERDGSFTVRQPAWHGLSKVLPEYPTKEEAKQIAHPWEPVEEPVYRKVPRIVPHAHSMDCDPEGCDLHDDFETVYEQITDFKAMVRDDDGFTLGVVSKSFEPVRNEEMYEIAEAIEGQDKGSVQYETGGSLKGGAKVWLLLKLAEPLIIKNDPRGATLPYFGLQNAHDGSGAFRGQSMMTRIVCDNTAQMADLEAKSRGTEFTFRHTKNVKQRIEQAQQALAGWRDSVERYNDLMNHLSDQKVTAGQRELFVERFIPMPPPHVVSDRVVNNVEQARSVIRGILNSVTCEGINDSAYGLVQAAVEYGEHYRAARSAESRFRRAYLNRSVITSDALALAQIVVGVDA